MFETLEARRLLTASLNNGVLTISGGAAGDSLIAENQGDKIKVIENGSKISTFKLNKVSSIVFNGLAGNDTLTNRSSKPSIMNGGQDNDIMIGSPAVADDFNGGTESDTVTYVSRSQNLSLTVGGASDGANGGDEGDNIRGDIERVIGGSGNDVISGSPNAETLEGGPGNDELHGLAGNDIVNGGTGDDLVDGGAGDDNMQGGANNDTYYEVPGSADVMTDTGGIDTLDFSGAVNPINPFGGINLDLSLDTGQLQSIFFLGATDTIALAGTFENVIGSAFGDIIRDNVAANRIDGGAGNDNVFGTVGDDWIIGGTDGDTLRGGDGNDLFDSVSIAADGADIILGGDGFDTLDLSHRSNDLAITIDSDGAHSVNDGEAGEQDEVISMEHVIGGSRNDQIGPGENANASTSFWFEGRAGNDTLTGGAGGDRLFGDAGDDRLVANDGASDTLDGGTGGETLGDTAVFDSALDVVSNCEKPDCRAAGDRADGSLVFVQSI